MNLTSTLNRHGNSALDDVSVPATAAMSVGQYLIQRLRDYGINDLFGIPGDYVLSFYSLLEQSDINVVGCDHVMW
jgi:indolepyruvate decarboxylase